MTTRTITIAAGAVNAKLVKPPQEALQLVNELLSYKVDGANFMTGLGDWNGRSSFFEYDQARFPAGFVIKVFKEFTRLGWKVNLVRKPLPAPLGPKNPKVDAFEEDPRYDYQAKVVELMERYGQIIARVATGGGKSRIAKLIHARLARKTLFLTTRGILMHQMRDAFMVDMRVPVGIFGDDRWSERTELMNVGMVQSFAARLRGPDPKDPIDKQQAQLQRQRETLALLAEFEVLILEEAHEASSDSYYAITQGCVNALYRCALTATPFMKDSEQANLQLEAASGPVAITVSERMLIERGILARPYFKFIDLGPAGADGVFVDKEKGDVPCKLYKSTPWQKAYEVGIAGNIARNRVIVQEVRTAAVYGLTSMVLVAHKSHGRRLEALLTAAGVPCEFIEGENNQKERQRAIRMLKSGAIQCLIGSTILDVGVDIPAVGLVVLAGAGKAEVAIRQRIGRGLRAKKSGPNVCFVIDFTDAINNHLRAHARERRQIVDTTDGFAQGVVSSFPYESLGFVRKAA
jgi:superfamily II DNA or RNA helicase